MNERDFLQLALYLGALVVLTPLLGKFMARVFQGERTLLSPVLGPIERLIYRLGGVDASKEMTWLTYTGALLAFNILGCLVTLVQLMTQAWLPLNPANLPNVPFALALNSDPGNTFIDRMISMVEGAKRQKTPNEIALGILLVSLTALFVLAVFTLPAFARYSEKAAGQTGVVNVTIPVLVALLVCLIPTTIGGLLSAIGIRGIDRLVRRNVLATSGRAVEAAGDIDVLLLDKTGTITMGNRMAVAFHPAPGVAEDYLAGAAPRSSLAEETPEGRSVVVLAKEKFNLRARQMHELNATFISFTAQTRMSGVEIPAHDGKPAMSIRKGAAQAVKDYVESLGGAYPQGVSKIVEEVSRRGATPLVVAEGMQVLGVIELKDVVKGGIKERFAQLRKMGIRTIMITGDNALTATAIAAEPGVDDFMAQATPEDKLKCIREEQAAGRLVAMTGEGTNDAPALAQADVGVAMSTGTQAAREAGNMVDLDSNPTKLIEIVEIGKQLLMTRGALTTFSIANDVAKYFAILPAMFGALYLATGAQDGPLAALNVMGLHSPESAILSAVIFNALIIIAIIPLALAGVRYRAVGAAAVLQRNVLFYGVGGLIAPFVGIKLIDVASWRCTSHETPRTAFRGWNRPLACCIRRLAECRARDSAPVVRTRPGRHPPPRRSLREWFLAGRREQQASGLFHPADAARLTPL